MFYAHSHVGPALVANHAKILRRFNHFAELNAAKQAQLKRLQFWDPKVKPRVLYSLARGATQSAAIGMHSGSDNKLVNYI